MSDTLLRGLDHFNYPTIRESLSPQREAVWAAHAEVEAIVDSPLSTPGDLQMAQQERTCKLRELKRGLAELSVGRNVTFISGISRGTLVLRSLRIGYLTTKQADMKGIRGTIVAADIDAKDIEVFDVGVKGSVFPPKLPRTYRVRANEALFRG